MTSVDCDLLVVGLGPVGDVLAALGALQGLKVIAIDREDAPHPFPRAAAFDDEVMRIFQMIGVADRLLPHVWVPDVGRFLGSEGEVLLEYDIGGEGPFGWARSFMLHQPSVEQALRERLSELDVDVRLRTGFAGLEQFADQVTVQVDGPDGRYPITARFVVGCDGARSPVRDAASITLFDYDFNEPWLVLDALVDDAVGLPRVFRQFCDPRRPATHMAMGGRRYRWEFMLKPGETPEQMLDDAFIATLLEPWIGADRLTIERKAVYVFHGLVATRWRDGRVLIAGDAAHQMPPFAGQGMCSGIRDAANLGWKLAAIVRDDAPIDLLDSYQIEREPHARAIIETAIGMGRMVCMIDADGARARDRQMLAMKAAGQAGPSLVFPDLAGGPLLTDSPRAGALFPQPVVDGHRFDDLLGLEPSLIGRDLPADHGAEVQQIDLGSPAVAPFREPIADWLRSAGGEAVLLRPDRHVFGTGKPAMLLRQWREALEATD